MCIAGIGQSEKDIECKVAIDKLVWDFRVNGSELCKRQLLEIIEDVVLRDIMLRECTMRLNGLKVVYQFCMQEHIEDLRIYYTGTGR